MKLPLIIHFDDAVATCHELVGGKGANLGKMSQAGFSVPPGFTITTAAYDDFLQHSGLSKTFKSLLDTAKYEDADQLEAVTAKIRDAIVEAPMPADLANSIRTAYATMGAQPYVAVRSSGTAEDLTGASFAGLHDTYLDIRGEDELLDAVKRCWASLWSSRAVSYRHTKQFDHFKNPLAVVVQTMVESATAGVMFTGNPLTDSTNEFVINASWGLGEAVVSGIANPDEFLIDAATLSVKKRTLGGKEQKIVRDPKQGRGTVQLNTSEADRQCFSLTDEQASALGELGWRVTQHYDGIPQDIEWALAGGKLYLLQSRPVTGAEFSWDTDVDGWQTLPDDPEILWTRSWADEQWCGAVTPLFYSWRARMFTAAIQHNALGWGVPELRNQRLFKFHRAEAYFSTRAERLIIEKTLLPMFRAAPNMLNHLPQDWHEEVKTAPLSLAEVIQTYARIGVECKPSHGHRAFLAAFDNYFDNRSEEANGLPAEKIRELSDADLCRYIDKCIDYEIEFAKDLWTGYYIYARDAFCVLGWMLQAWYDGGNEMAFAELLTGMPKRTATMEENTELWELSEAIRSSPALTMALQTHEDRAFFDQLEHSDEGRIFLARYREFARKHAHRGHAERDIFYLRRCEDPGIDYRAFRALLSGPSMGNPLDKEHEINARRDAVVAEVVANLRAKPMGELKAEAFQLVVDWLLQFLVVRDNERYLIDRSTYAAKRGYLELSRRLLQRGLVESDRDFYFLSRNELYEFFEGHANHTLVRAKIAGRMRDFDRFHARSSVPPLHLQDGRAVELDSHAVHAGDGTFQGIGTSRGEITGTARVIKTLAGIGALQKGDILITNSTDPGWTPVFLMIGGIVLETGGMLAHGSLLAREYGLPAVQLQNATQHIPDGARITINGHSGRITIEAE